MLKYIALGSLVYIMFQIGLAQVLLVGLANILLMGATL